MYISHSRAICQTAPLELMRWICDIIDDSTRYIYLIDICIVNRLDCVDYFLSKHKLTKDKHLELTITSICAKSNGIARYLIDRYRLYQFNVCEVCCMTGNKDILAYVMDNMTGVNIYRLLKIAYDNAQEDIIAYLSCKSTNLN